MQKDRTVVYRQSSDRPNIKIGVRKIKYTLNSFADLMFLIPAGLKVGDPLPPKFLVFFDNIPDSIKAVTVLHQRLPPELRDRIKWFNADMSTTFKEEELENLLRGETWGFCMMTSFGMHFGHAVQDWGLMGTALLFAEKEFFDDEKATKAARKAQKAEKHKRTAQEVNLPGAACPLKRAAVSSIRQMTKNDPPSRPSQPVISQSNEGVDGDTNRSSDEESDGDEGETVHANAPDQISTEPAGSLEALLQVAIKEKSAEFHTTSSKRRKRDLDPMIDYLINAERYNYSDHLECDPHTDVPHTSRAAQRFHPPKYMQMEQDRALGDALHDWQEDKTSALFGWAALNDFGPCLVMPNSILNCIINCAHYNKIKTLQDLKKETGWTKANKLGSEVITLIQCHALPRSSPLTGFCAQ
ncbi:hypothetical protein SCLCIDRAFT_12054 [Scleroderma citrinum Foug A]|uniref:Uncharacterized protein n=1 Tax=Scleroderma citrinum Foug A TaxID=1036808 RepID=A0A0C3D6M1_9AGAM|nr:hypothetical protein SCLCIDRAFT_12054 [Scleroderma citrinum Foug A]